MTAPTVPEVKQWEPESLRTTMIELAEIVKRVDAQRICALEEQDALAETWHGDAADAAAARIVAECSSMAGVARSVEQLAARYGDAAGIVSGAQAHVTALVSAAENSGFEVQNDGTVTADNLIAKVLVGSGSGDAEVAALRSTAAGMTAGISDALAQAGRAAADAAEKLSGPTGELDALAHGNPAGPFRIDADGKSVWTPTSPATVAASVIGVVADVTGRSLEEAALESSDEVAARIGRAFGPVMSAVGTVPAIMEDIDDGMDPTEAIVSEGVGFAAGTLVSSLAAVNAGAAIGTLICPGIGTIGGVVIGGLFGYFAGESMSNGLTTAIQSTWEEE